MVVDNALKDELNAYKVATIVLAVVAGLALICIIILIRYYIVRQHTASQYRFSLSISDQIFFGSYSLLLSFLKI